MSASKAVLARAVALLELRGLVDVNAEVRRYIPEFCAPEVTVLDVLTHRSGCTMPVLSSKPELWHDWANVVAALRAEPPRYPRGTLACQPIAFGWILTEVLQRITELSLQAFSARELGDDLSWTTTEAAAHTYWLGAKRYMLNGENLATRFEHTNNNISSRTALVPGAGLLASARALAAFYDSLLQDKSESFRRYTSVATRGFDKISGAYVTLGRGFGLGWRWPHPYGWWSTQRCFGHPGGFSVVAYADPTTRPASPLSRMAIARSPISSAASVRSVQRFAASCVGRPRATRHRMTASHRTTPVARRAHDCQRSEPTPPTVSSQGELLVNRAQVASSKIKAQVEIVTRRFTRAGLPEQSSAAYCREAEGRLPLSRFTELLNTVARVIWEAAFDGLGSKQASKRMVF